MNAPWEGARPRALRRGEMILDLTLTLDRVCRGLRELRIAGIHRRLRIHRQFDPAREGYGGQAAIPPNDDASSLGGRGRTPPGFGSN